MIFFYFLKNVEFIYKKFCKKSDSHGHNCQIGMDARSQEQKQKT